MYICFDVLDYNDALIGLFTTSDSLYPSIHILFISSNDSFRAALNSLVDVSLQEIFDSIPNLRTVGPAVSNCCVSNYEIRIGLISSLLTIDAIAIFVGRTKPGNNRGVKGRGISKLGQQ